MCASDDFAVGTAFIEEASIYCVHAVLMPPNTVDANANCFNRVPNTMLTSSLVAIANLTIGSNTTHIAELSVFRSDNKVGCNMRIHFLLC